MIVTFDSGLRYMGDSIEPHQSILRDMVGYYFDKNTAKSLESFVKDGDKAYRSSERANPSYTFNCNSGGKFIVLPLDVWSDAKDSVSAVKDLAHLGRAIAEEGYMWHKSASNLAGRICREYTETKQLPIRWREMAHNAIHQGPMVVVNGGADNVVALDREKAFLKGLYAPVPVGSWIAVRQQSFESVRGMHGICRATVRVSPDLYQGRIPPLPVRYYGYTVYPVGELTGTWTLDMLFDAIDNGGYEVVHIFQVMICQTAPVHAKAAERIEQIKDKQLKKLLYTRYWGRLAALGGYEGYREKLPDVPDKRIVSSELSWYYVGTSPLSFSAPIDYRPDHSAFIASTNHLAMNRAIRLYGDNEIVATHIDCIWTANTDIDPKDTFRVKHSGNARFYGVGCYRVGDEMAAQGYDGVLTPEALETWGANLHSGGKIYRRWHFEIEPNTSRNATSDPPIFKYMEKQDSNLPGNIYWSGWTSNGWLKERADG